MQQLKSGLAASVLPLGRSISMCLHVRRDQFPTLRSYAEEGHTCIDQSLDRKALPIRALGSCTMCARLQVSVTTPPPLERRCSRCAAAEPMPQL